MVKPIRLISALLGLLLGGTLAAQAPLEKVRLQLKWTHQFQFAGYYAEQGNNHVFEVLGVTIRQGAYYHALICGSPDRSLVQPTLYRNRLEAAASLQRLSPGPAAQCSRHLAGCKCLRRPRQNRLQSAGSRLDLRFPSHWGPPDNA